MKTGIVTDIAVTAAYCAVGVLEACSGRWCSFVGWCSAGALSFLLSLEQRYFRQLTRAMYDYQETSEIKANGDKLVISALRNQVAALEGRLAAQEKGASDGPAS